MKNTQVINAWNNNKPAHASNGRGALRTDGNRLWSYGLCIGRSDEEGNKIIFDFVIRSKSKLQRHTFTGITGNESSWNGYGLENTFNSFGIVRSICQFSIN